MNRVEVQVDQANTGAIHLRMSTYKFRVSLKKNPTLRERLTDSNAYDIYMKHRTENLRTRYLHLAAQDTENRRVGDEIDELLKNYMDVSFCRRVTNWKV